MLAIVNFAAGETKEFREKADFFRLLSTTGGAVDIKFFRLGAEVADAPVVQPGYAEQFRLAIDTVSIKSLVTQTVQFATRVGSIVSYDTPPGGSLIFPANQGPVTQIAYAVTTASTVMEPAKADRRYLLIQNNDPAVTIYVNLTGAAATAATGIKIGPGGSFEVNGYAPTAAITVIGTGATSAVTVVEG